MSPIPQKRHKLTTSVAGESTPSRSHHSRRARAGLLALVAVAGIAAAAILFAKYQLEGLRGRIQHELEARTGAALQAGAIDAYGLRGIRIQEFSAEFTADQGHTLRVEVPVVNIYIDFLDLVYGELSIERLQMDNAQIHLFRPLDQPWVPSKAESGPGWQASPPPFRITAEGCEVEIIHAAGDATVAITDAGFDVYHLPDGRDFSGRIWGNLDGDPTRSFVVNGRYASQEDFDVQAQATRIEARDINEYLPEGARLVTAGAAEPFARVTAYPGNPLLISLKSPFHAITVSGTEEYIAPASGDFNALAAYDLDARVLSITTAEVRSDQLGGRLGGDIRFGEHPELNLDLQVDRLPVADLVQRMLADRTAAYGAATLNLGEAYKLAIQIVGPASAPNLSVDARADNASLSFTPSQPLLPAASLELDGLRVNWISGGAIPEALLSIRGGKVDHDPSNLHIQDLAGVIKVTSEELIAESLQGTFAGNAIVARGRYNLKAKEGQFDASGVIANLEKTIIGDVVPKTPIEGSAAVRCSGHILEQRYMLDIALDLTQTRIAHDWWFEKAIGVGASIKGLNLDIRPKNQISFSGVAEVGTTRANVTGELKYQRGKWQMKSVRAKSDQVDIASLGRCFQVPYTLSMGTGTNAVFEWDQVSEVPGGNIIRIAGDIDEVSALPDGIEQALHCTGVHVEARWDNSNLERKSGTLLVSAADAALPAFGQDWLLPLHPRDPAKPEDFEEEDRDWTYTLRAERLDVPPWKGTKFSGVAFTIPGKTGLREFGANVGEGRIEGAYTVAKPENVATLDIKWSQVPVHFFLDHLEWPQMVSGDVTGSLLYTMDSDDPGTLTGKGAFEIFDGQFSADYLFSLFEKQFSSNLAGLPPSLKFRQLKADLVLDGDVVRTPELILQGESLRIAADGRFITHGDMDYNLKVTLSPETAKEIPLLRDYFNLEGHRFTQNDLELAFRVSGPIFNPSGSVTELPPMGVTLVSGAAEMTGEAIKVIDLPRQILLDLFKIGGGIVGPPR